MKVEPDGTWAWAVIGARFGAYSGYKRAKAKGYTGWRKWGTIAGGALIGSIGIGKIGQKAVTSYRLSKISPKARKTYKAYEKINGRKN